MEMIQFGSMQDHNVAALLVLPFFCATGFVGNMLVCIAIAIDRRLQNVTNYFLFSLALADLLVCSVVMPLAILVEVQHGVWIWDFWLCLVYTYADVFLCSASIVHISVISLDRYLGISRPLKVRNKSRTVVALKIVFVWVITVVISSPLAVLAFLEPTNILYDNSCAIRSQHYMIYGSILAFLIPFIIMTTTFTKTTKLLNKQASTLAQKPADGFNQGLRRTVINKKKRRQNCVSNSPTVSTINPPSGGRKKQHSTDLKMEPVQKISNGSVDVAHPVTRNNSNDIPESRTTSPVKTEDAPLISENGKQVDFYELPPKQDSIRHRLNRRSTYLRSHIGRIHSRLKEFRKKHQDMKTSTELANEHKASRVLAVVFACFFTCWTPFFIMNFTLGFCGQCVVPARVSSIILWLGYLSSTLNPIIYTIFNRRFREAFIKILRCQFGKPREHNQVRSHVYLTGDATWSYMDKSALLQPKESITALNGNNSLSTTTTLAVPSKTEARIQRHRLRTQHSHDEPGAQRKLSVEKPRVRRNSDSQQGRCGQNGWHPVPDSNQNE